MVLDHSIATLHGIYLNCMAPQLIHLGLYNFLRFILSLRGFLFYFAVFL